MKVLSYLQCAEFKEGRSPRGRDLDRAKVIGRLVRRGTDEIKGQAVLRQPQQLFQQLMLRFVVEVEALPVVVSRAE